MKIKYKMPAVEHYMVMMTPELAEQFLVLNQKNRPVRQNHIDFVQREIESGRYVFNGDTIRIDTENTLIDGQHRLNAVIASGIAVPMLIVEGVEPRAFETLDSGPRRSASDVLAIEGYQHYKMAAAATRIINYYLTSGAFRGKAKHSNKQIIELVREYGQPLIEACHWCSGCGFSLIPHSVLAALRFIFMRIDEKDGREFMRLLADGTGLEEHSPVFTLRKRLVSNATEKAKLSPVYKAAITIYAWNAFRNKVKIVRYLRWNEGADFPTAV